MTMTALFAAALWAATTTAATTTAATAGSASAASGPGTPAPGKLAPAVAKEMTEAIVAANKALGLESWAIHGVQPCIDRGGQGITSKDVTADDTRKCMASALEKGFPDLGKSYVLAVPMGSIGPVTVIALGIADSEGWCAYSCDPDRKCPPVKLSAPSKWGKRMAERQVRACAETTTLWFPADERACPTPPTPPTPP